MELRVIHLGFGGWGRSWHNDVITKHPRIKVAATVDLDPSVRQSIVSELGVDPKTCFATLDEALNAVEADAVINTSNVTTHAPVGKTALKAGLHYLVEKPFADKQRSAIELIDLARRKRRILMVAQNYRFHPAVRAVQRIISSGELGRVATAWVDFRQYANNRDPKTNHFHIEQPLLLDMAVHQFDMLRGVLGCEPKDIICRTSNPKWSQFDEAPSATAIMTFGRDILVNYRGSWIAHECRTAWTGEWVIECEKGAIVWSSRGDLPDQDQVAVHTNGARKRRVRLPKLRYLDRLGVLDAFVKAVADRKQPETSGRDNLGTIKLVHAAIQSARRGQRIRI